MSLTMRNDKLVQKRFDTLRSEAYKKYANDPEMAKLVAGSLSTTALILAGIWAEFYDEFNYDSPWIMSTMGKVTPFIKSFSNERLTNIALEDLPNTVVTLFVVPENNRIEIIIGKTPVTTITVTNSKINVTFAKEKQFELSEFVKEHVKAALVKLERLTQLTEDIVNDMINGESDEINE